jgi:hypothetical protein
VEEIGRTRPTTVTELMEQANKFADREDTYNNKRRRSPEVDRRVDRGDDAAAGIIKEGKIRWPQVMY